MNDKIACLQGRIAALLRQKQYAQAEKTARKVLLLNEKSCAARHALAICRMQAGGYEQAIREIERIHAQEPRHMGAYLVLAHIHKRRGEIDDELAVLERIVNFSAQRDEQSLSAEDAAVCSEALSLLGSAYTLIGRIKDAMACFLRASGMEKDPRQKIVEYSNYLFTANYEAAMDPAALLEIHARCNILFADVERYQHTRGSRESETLHIGYISPDFRRHAAAFFCYPLLAYFDRQRLRVTCYSSGSEDATTRQLKGLSVRWRDIRALTPDAAAALIYDDRVDILFDLAGHTANNSLAVLARRPAPVQMSGIGYFNTTGLRDVDYFLTDGYCDPTGTGDAFFTERLVRLPHSHLCYTAGSEMPECAPFPPCVKNGFITFGSFNNFSKVTADVLLVWSGILRRVPRSRLLLKSRLFASASGRIIAARRLREAGIEAERAELRPATGGYLSEYHEVDIALDTFPYPGGATTCEALYMGVPVVSLIGSRHGARFGYGLLQNAGLGALAADSEAAYIETAAALADDTEKLTALRHNLRRRMIDSPLMDGRRYARDMEAAYFRIWQRWNQETEPLVSILIPTYNRPHYLQIALESAVRQTYSQIEIIVCDNSTNEDTARLLEQYRPDPRIRYIRNRGAKSKAENFHLFEFLTRGEYLQWLMDDDVLDTDKIEKMLRCFQENPNVTLVTSARRWIDKDGNEIGAPGGLKFDMPDECVVIRGEVLAQKMLTFMQNLIGEPSAFLFKKKDLQHHYWNADCQGLQTISDVAMGIELLEHGDCGYFQMSLSSYRRHEGQEGQQMDVVVRSRIEWLDLVETYYRRRRFLTEEAVYLQTLRQWLEDARILLPQARKSGQPESALLMEYQRRITEVKKVFLSK